jgi:S1-C subfamily serine protease
MTKIIFKILLVFLLGVFGGVWAQVYLLPYLASRPFFEEIDLIKNLGEREMTINPIQRITVQENTALIEAITKVEKTVIGVKTKTNAEEILEGSGLVLTSDGLVVTLANLVPQGSDFYFYANGQWLSFQILKRDIKNNLALIKLSGENLGTSGFADLEKTKIGERVFLLNMEFEESTSTNKLLITPNMSVNEGIISFITADQIKTNIYEVNAAGSPLFNIAGDIIGLNAVDQLGRVSIIPISVIREFAGL